jgi:hypothetical protein
MEEPVIHIPLIIVVKYWDKYTSSINLPAYARDIRSSSFVDVYRSFVEKPGLPGRYEWDDLIQVSRVADILCVLLQWDRLNKDFVRLLRTYLI